MRICSSSHDLSTENNYNFTHKQTISFVEKNNMVVNISNVHCIPTA